MNTLAISLVILSAIMHAFRDFITKKANDKQIFAWWFQLFSLILFSPFFIYFLFTEGIKTLVGIYIALASGFVISLHWYSLTKTYESGDLSHVYPIMRSSPALVLIFAVIILKEQVSLTGVLGILSVALGAYIINMEKISLYGLLKPLRSIFENRTTRFAFLTLISLSVIAIIDKVGVGYTNPFIYIFLIYSFGFIFFTPYVFYAKDKASIKHEWKINKKIILINGFFAIFGYALIIIAFTIEKVSYVIGLRQLSIVFAVLLGAFLLKEKRKTIRFLAASLIFIGAFLISVAN